MTTLFTNGLGQGGLLCHAHEMLRSFLVALDRSVQDEQDMATQVSDEEWEAIRPSKEDRMAMLLSHVKVGPYTLTPLKNATFHFLRKQCHTLSKIFCKIYLMNPQDSNRTTCV